MRLHFSPLQRRRVYLPFSDLYSGNIGGLVLNGFCLEASGSQDVIVKELSLELVAQENLQGKLTEIELYHDSNLRPHLESPRS